MLGVVMSFLIKEFASLLNSKFRKFKIIILNDCLLFNTGAIKYIYNRDNTRNIARDIKRDSKVKLHFKYLCLHI